MDSWDRTLGRGKAAKGERAATAQYVGDDETVLTRSAATGVHQSDDDREVMDGNVTALVTDRRLILLHSTGGFRPKWSAITLPYGHLEPVSSTPDATPPTEVLVATSGRRGYRVTLDTPAAAAAFATGLAGALTTYRRERMGLPD